MLLFVPHLLLGAQTEVRSGDLRLGLRTVEAGITLDSLYDTAVGRDLLATNNPGLFSLVLRRVGATNEIRLEAGQGWQTVDLRRTRRGLEARWEQPLAADLAGLAVTVTARAESKASAWHWRLQIENRTANWSIWRVVFPQVALQPPGENAAIFFPRGPGEVQYKVWDRRFSLGGNYPGGWCSMQFMAAFAEGDHPTGLYLGLHDPWGGPKDLRLESQPGAKAVRLRFEHPASDLGLRTNHFELSGEAVWQLLRGDWFDAALIYKAWARREARWWPALKSGQRADTPAWMRELDAWAMTGGRAADCATNVLRFREYIGEPVGFHWYNWHQIPFDNDYPHYFPAKPDFASGVAALEQAGVRVMPYINGRLWDTHDRGDQDDQFTRIALLAATKQPDGRPYVETYNSKESNGQKVSLAVMCPSTRLWQETVSDIVLRLVTEVGTSGVYIDQIAAAAPVLCTDKSHGHPLGGGHWWNEGYWRMLDNIRRAKPADAMLTTECNGEPFVRWFDGYLTWHWQFDGQVPAFPAIYGGTIQMFGRAYRGGSTKALALRMKAAQQLVFGEQLGWLDPGVVNEPENAAFFREMVRLRARYRRYFYAGEMARPPRLEGALPKVKADWQWSGEWWVTTDAVLTGAWKIPGEKRMALLFVNVGDDPVKAGFFLEPRTYGIRTKKVRWTRSAGAQAPDNASVVPVPFRQELNLGGRQAEVWEVAW